MAKRKEEPEKEANSERWLLTYADMITLLMLFFIVLYSMSTINEKKFASLASSMSTSLGGKSVISEYPDGNVLEQVLAQQNSLSEQQKQSESEKIKSQTELKQLQQQLNDFAKLNNLSGQITTYIDERGLVASFNAALLFELGSADIDDNSRTILIKIEQLISTIPNYIRIEGYTDNLPIHTAKFPSNWELASQRAINVAKVLIEAGIDPSKISSMSYGEYRPSYANTTIENMKKNRCVNIIIIRKEYDKLEPGLIDTKTTTATE